MDIRRHLKSLLALLLSALILALPVAAQAASLEDILSSMTLEEKVGQMIIARGQASGAETVAATYHVGGFVMFADTFEKRTPKTVRAYFDKMQAASKIPLLICVDEEGGTVTRVSRYKAYRKKKFASPMSVYQNGGTLGLISDTREKSELLLSLGINVNFAPVADIAQRKGDFIYKRTIGEDASTTADCIAAIVTQMNESGIGSCLKHFPGYGGSSDTHAGMAYDNRGKEAFIDGDFLPFIAGMEAGADSVMVSHNIVKCMDKNYPASLSPTVHRVLREYLSFDGVIITDDLNMAAITDNYGREKAGVQAVIAGNDMLITGAYKTQSEAIINAVRNGKIEEERIDESVLRILKWKQKLGLLP